MWKVVLLVAAAAACANAQRTLRLVGEGASITYGPNWSAGSSPADKVTAKGIKTVGTAERPGYAQMPASTFSAGKRWVIKNFKFTFKLEAGEKATIVFGGQDNADDDMNEFMPEVQWADCASNYQLSTVFTGTNMVDDFIADNADPQPDDVLAKTFIQSGDTIDLNWKVVYMRLADRDLNKPGHLGFMDINRIINVAGIPSNVVIDSCEKAANYADILKRQIPDLCQASMYPDPTSAKDLPSHKGRWWLSNTANCGENGHVDEQGKCLEFSSCPKPFQTQAIKDKAIEAQEAIAKQQEQALAQKIAVTFTGSYGDPMTTLNIASDMAECHMEAAKELEKKFSVDAADTVESSAFVITDTSGDYSTFTASITTNGARFFGTYDAREAAGLSKNSFNVPWSTTSGHSAAGVEKAKKAIAAAVAQCLIDNQQQDLEDAQKDLDDAIDACTTCDNDDVKKVLDMADENPDLVKDILDAVDSTDPQGDLDAIKTQYCAAAQDQAACEQEVDDAFTTLTNNDGTVKDAVTKAADKAQEEKEAEDAKQYAPVLTWFTVSDLVVATSKDSAQKFAMAGAGNEELSGKIKDKFVKELGLFEDMKNVIISVGDVNNRRRRQTDAASPLQVEFNASHYCAHDDQDCIDGVTSQTDWSSYEDIADAVANGYTPPLPKCRISWSSLDINEACASDLFDDCVNKFPNNKAKQTECKDQVQEELTKCDNSGFKDPPANTECWNDVPQDDDYDQRQKDLAALAAKSQGTPAPSTDSGGGGLPIIPIAAAAAGVVLIAAAVVVAIKKGWIGGGKGSGASAKADRNVVAFENPMYDDPTSGVDSAPTYDAATGGDNEGLYDEPAFNQAANKDNPLYESTEDLTGGDEGGYLDTDAAGDEGGYLDTEPGGEEGGYLDVAPDE